MKYNQNIHHRRSIRLKGYDYSQAGLYFITICCDDRKNRFGNIVVGAGLASAQMVNNEYGQIAYDEWAKLPERFANFELDVFQIMPNHMHGIILLNDVVGAGFTPAQNVDGKNAGAGFTPAQNTDAVSENENIHIQIGQPQGLPLQNSDDDNEAGVNPARTNASIGDIVGAYKSLVSNDCLEIYKTKNEMMGKLWQRNYHEHIIPNGQSYQTISNYIINNPGNWSEDKFYKK